MEEWGSISINKLQKKLPTESWKFKKLQSLKTLNGTQNTRPIFKRVNLSKFNQLNFFYKTISNFKLLMTTENFMALMRKRKVLKIGHAEEKFSVQTTAL
jgi:hypothetical protein